MKEQNLDDLERMFKEGLRDLKSEPDAAVWDAIQDAMKRRKRFWLFWSFTGMLAVGLVVGLFMLNDAQEPVAEVPSAQGEMPSAQSGERKAESVEMPSAQGEMPSAQRGERKAESVEMPSAQGEMPSAQSGERKAESVENGVKSGEETETGTANSQQPIANSRARKGAGGREQGETGTGTANSQQPIANSQTRQGTGGREQGETGTGTANTQNPIANSQQPIANSPNPKPQSPIPSISTRTIPFVYQKEVPSLAFVNGYTPPVAKTGNPPSDSNLTNSPWSVDFNPALLLPSIHSVGQTGKVNYEKNNVFKPGISFGLNLNYTFKQNWILRAGVDWSSYTVAGNHRRFHTDTLEWIDRERQTGFQIKETSRTWDFESQYQWIGIPIEVGRRQNFGSGFSWEWTLGTGVNYLYKYAKIAEGNPYFSAIDEINRMQFNLSAGFGVNYHVKGPWSTFVNVRYRYQLNRVYASDFLMEKHQILRFGIGVQYQFKWKGN